jgi:hypothetical protein
MAFKSVEFDPEFAGPQAWALMYREQGWQVVPAYAPGEDVQWKRPIIGWKEYETALAPPATFERWFGATGQYRHRWNMGAVTGEASGRVFILDLDQSEGKDGAAWWLGLLAVHNNGLEPETPSQRTGGGGRQLAFRAPEGWTPPTFKTRLGVDIRGQGGFAMLPPSRHQSGLQYEWELGREPWYLPVLDAPQWLIDAIDKLREEFARNAGQGVQHLKESAEQNAFGLTDDGREQRMANIIWGVACDLRRALSELPHAPKNHPLIEAERERAWGLYLFEVKSRVQGVSLAEGLEQEGRGRSAFDDRWTRALAQWGDKLQQEAASPKPNPPPKPRASNAENFDPWSRLTVPSFPLQHLPTSQQAFIEYQTKSLGADSAGVAMATLTAMSGALDQRFALKMRRSGDWFAPPRLWAILVGEPATKKTPIMNAVLKPLRHIEADYAAQHRRDMAIWDEQEKAEKGAKPPHPTRFIVTDATTEIVAEILGRQARGALMVHDELSGFIGSLDRYGSGRGAGDRAFWLTAYNGGPYSVDRMQRSLYVSNLCVAFLGGMQPDRLRELSDLMTDGLLQRFNPVLIERGAPSAEVESELAAMRYSDQVTFLAHMKPLSLMMTEAALRVAEDFRAEVYELESEPGVLGRGFCAWAGKLSGTHGSLMLLLHILEHRDEAPYLQVGEDTARRAAAIVSDFLIPHGRVFYQSTLDADSGEGLQTVASYLLTSEQDRFTLSDLRYNARPLRDVKNAWEMNALLSPFVSGGWLTEDLGGKAWNVADGLRDKFAERRADELERKAKILNRFKVNGVDHDPAL